MRLRKFVPFVLLIGVLLVAACAPVTPVIPQTGPEGQGQSGTVMPGDSGQGGTGSDQGGQTGQDGAGTGDAGTGNNQGGSSGTGGTGTDNNQDGTGGTGSDQGGSTGSAGGIIGGSGSQGGSTGGNTAPSPSGSQNELNENLRNSIAQFVSQQGGGNAGNVEVIWAQQVDFRNGCLEVTNQGEMCSQVITPGWQVVARSNGELYVIHANAAGNNVRWNQNVDADSIMGSGSGTGSGQDGSGSGTGNNNQGGTGGNTGGTGGTGGTGSDQGGSTGGNAGGNGGVNQGGGADGGGLRVGLDQVINLAAQFLGQTLNVPLNQVSFSSITVETWSDSCLGVGQANESCAQVTTPGYRLSFSAGGQSYEIRTDSTGSNIRLVQGAQQ